MPKNSIDYSRTIIYKLVHKDDIDNANIYVGSTTDFVVRKYNHKNCCHNQSRPEYNQKKYQYIRENGGWENWLMIEIEKYPCNDQNEALSRERYWYEKLQSNLNSHYPNRNSVEYSKDNSEKVKVRCKDWYENNKEYCQEQHKQYRINNKQKCAEIEKQWRENNKEYRQNQQKEWRDKNKDEISAKKKIKMVCECGAEFRQNDKARHLRSKKHQEFEKRK